MTVPQSVAVRRAAYHNPSAREWISPPATSTEEIAAFHRKLLSYVPTRLTSLPEVAEVIGVGAVYLKDESQRCGLPSFKILGASWAACRAIAAYTQLPVDSELRLLAAAAQAAGIALTAATDGNHGRAIARMSSILGLKAYIFVPKNLDAKTVELVRGEGCEVTVVDGDYDQAVRTASAFAKEVKERILVQDTSFNGYEEIPQWVVDGYSTMMEEIETQLHGRFPDLIVAPVGVGSFAQAVVSHAKKAGRSTRVLCVEPDTAACLWTSLNAGEPVQVTTRDTIMAGMNCGTVSTNAWPTLRAGVDVSVTVSDIESHEAVTYLSRLGIAAGPCGAATLSGLKYAVQPGLGSCGLTKDSVIVLLCTEGTREYKQPLDVRIQDPVQLTQSLVRINSANPDLSREGGAGETVIAEYITAWLEHRDIENHWLEKTAGRPSVIGVVRGTGDGKGKSLMFNGHIDTVTTASYSGDPLSGHIQDGSVYGRGAFDMKAGIAAALIALSQAKIGCLSGDVIIAAVADEEHLSAGTEEVLEAGWHADGAVVVEPTGLGVMLAHKGFMWLQVDILGQAAHGSRYDLGVDAICKAGYFLVELERYSREILEGPAHPDLGTGSIHASLIQGGEEPSSYPAKCTISIERRTVPGDTPATVTNEIKRILDSVYSSTPGFKYEMRTGMSRPPFEISQSDPFVAGAMRNIETVLNRPNTLRPGWFWTDCALLAEKGIPTFLFGVDGGGAHAKTEWATLDSIRAVTDALILIANDFCK